MGNQKEKRRSGGRDEGGRRGEGWCQRQVYGSECQTEKRLLSSRGSGCQDKRNFGELNG